MEQVIEGTFLVVGLGYIALLLSRIHHWTHRTYRAESELEHIRSVIDNPHRLTLVIPSHIDVDPAFVEAARAVGLAKMERELKRLQALNEKAAANVAEAHRKAKEARVCAVSTSRPDINTQEFSTQLAKSLPLHLALDFVEATDFVNDVQVHMVRISFSGIVLDETSKHHNKAWQGNFNVEGRLLNDPAFHVVGVVRAHVLQAYRDLVREGR